MNRNQKLALSIGGVLTVLSLAAGMYGSAGIIAILTGLAWRKFDTRGKRPEDAAVRSVRCAQCGAIGEPNWPKCPKCGAADWK
jgi:hypothetical protein